MFVRQSNRNGYMFSFLLSFSLLLLVSALVGSRRFAQLCHVVSLNNFQICYTPCWCWCFCLHRVSDFRFSLNYVPFSFLLYSFFIFLAHTKIYCTYVMEVSLGISAMKSHYSPSSTPTPVLLLAPLSAFELCPFSTVSSSLVLLSFVHSCCLPAFYLFIFNCISLCTKTATLADACTSAKCMRLLLLSMLLLLLLRIKC